MKKVGIYGGMIDKLYHAHSMIILNINEDTREYELEIVKDRWGYKIGVQKLEEVIEIFINIFIILKFNNSNKMFQETVRLKLEEELKKILIDNDSIPSDEIIEKYKKGE